MAARDANYYPGSAEYSSPGAQEIQRGFDQMRYSPMGVTETVQNPPLAEADVPEALSSPQPKPGYDRHII